MRPNIIFLFSDQQHWQAAGFTDSYYHTPNMDRMAGRSTVFTHCFCSTPLCSPSRATLMTGKMPTKHGVTTNGIPLKEHTIGHYLQEGGYETAYFGKWHLKEDPRAVKGWDEEKGVWDEYSLPNHPYHDDETTGFTLDWLKRHSHPDKPYALFMSLDEPHGIYWISKKAPYPADHCSRPELKPDTRLPDDFSKEDVDRLIHRDAFYEDSEGLSEEDFLIYRELYRDRVAAYDANIGKVLDLLEKQGRFEDSIIIITSDHGDMDTHHGLLFKGPVMYDQLQRVPLAVYVPEAFGGKGRVSIDGMISNTELFPTILDFAGCDIPVCDGFSLARGCLGEEQNYRDFVVVQYGSPGSGSKFAFPVRSMRTKTHKYNIYLPKGEELFDLAEDPLEQNNLADDSNHKETIKMLRQKLDDWMQNNNDPFYSFAENRNI